MFPLTEKNNTRRDNIKGLSDGDLLVESGLPKSHTICSFSLIFFASTKGHFGDNEHHMAIHLAHVLEAFWNVSAALISFDVKAEI